MKEKLSEYTLPSEGGSGDKKYELYYHDGIDSYIIKENGKSILDIRHEVLDNLLERSDNSDYAKCQHDYVEINGCSKYMECSKCGNKLI